MSTGVLILSSVGESGDSLRANFIWVIARVTAIFALLFPRFIWACQYIAFIDNMNLVLIVVAFHTCFSLLAALIFISFISQFEQVLLGLLTEQDGLLTRYLHHSLYSVPTLVIAVTHRVLLQTLADIYRLFIRFIHEEIITSVINANELDTIIRKVESYLEDNGYTTIFT